MSDDDRPPLAPDVIAAALGLLLLVAAAPLLAVTFGAAVIGCVAAAIGAAGVALLAWAYLP